MSVKPRLDEILVDRGYCEDLHAAQAAILEGQVIVGEHCETSAGKRLDPNISIRMKNGKGGLRGSMKLQGALDAFSYDPAGKNCADLGCSSGGFTKCLLQCGAAHVSAIDVGYGQFVWELRNDSRVDLYERTNVRGLDPLQVNGPFDLLVGDLSFLSIAPLMDDFARLLKADGDLIMLIKPQFEAARQDVGEGGVISDPEVHVRCVEKVVNSALGCGFDVKGLTFSPIKGPKGNIEFLLWCSFSGDACEKGSIICPMTIDGIVRDAHEILGS